MPVRKFRVQDALNLLLAIQLLCVGQVSVLTDSHTGGEACGYLCSEGEGFNYSGLFAERAFGVPNSYQCTLGTLMCPRLEGVFFASFLCRRWTKK